ncbi:MAG TPA: DUF4872 domain-containing protein [Gemmatimonadales bacterium]|jgi:hypothetical protein|nr:DUF4872 domain-containing protein [Gemmatimonadales bacterium]
MTTHKHLKQLVRARMGKTGESYTTARRQLLRQAAEPVHPEQAPYHFPGSVPTAAVLRALLTHAGVRQRDGIPMSEAMVFGIAGGIGAGVFSFHYAKEKVSTFYIAGRHLWQDPLAWAQAAAKRFKVKTVVKESSGLKPAEQQLRELLQGGRPVMTWVEGYRVVAVHGIDDGAGIALVGEVADEPRRMPLADLAATRARIKSQKNRLLALESAGNPPELPNQIREGISACVQGLTKGRMKNFTLEAFATWADRLDGSKAADSWEKIFPPGPQLYVGLRSINEYIEHFGTGGGLCRPLFAEFLEESAGALRDPVLGRLAQRYAKLGAEWSALADAALPDNIPTFRETKQLLAQKAEIFHSEGAAGWETGPCGKELGEFVTRMQREFPLDAEQCAALRKELKERVRSLYEAEVAAAEELATWAEKR